MSDEWFDRQMQHLTEERDRALEARKNEERQTYAWVKRCLMAEEQRNEDVLLMLEMEKVIAAAYRLVSGPDLEGYARLSGALDRYEQAKRERDRTY